MPPKIDYDYIITGAGCAGLSLLVRLLNSGKLNDKKILLLDKYAKNTNDRTWCFWEKDAGFFEEIVYRKWDKILFSADHFQRQYSIAPYQYKMIRGIDFYNYCFEIINRHPQVTIEYAAIEDFCGAEGDTWVQYNNRKVYAEYIFNSILFQKPPLLKKEFLLLQHFKGWEIETTQDVFNDDTATLMDFRTGQLEGTTFIYTMPLAGNRALIEYTLFTPSLLKAEAYDQGLKDYIARFYPGIDYTIRQQEFGIIPMTNHSFPPNAGNIIHIGTAGGQTKASTGYTFQFIQQHSDALANALIIGRSLSRIPVAAKKFNWYDSVLLNVLATGKVKGEEVFTTLFRKNKPAQIFKFLDNQSSLKEDIGIISSLPVWPFLKAGWQQL